MRTPGTYYRLGVAATLATVLFLVLAIGALGINGAGGEADRMYLAVPAVVLVGTALARLRPRGMALALVATALTHVVLAVVALAAGYHQDAGASAMDILGINAMYAALFAGSAWLFRRSAEESPAVRETVGV